MCTLHFQKGSNFAILKSSVKHIKVVKRGIDFFNGHYVPYCTIPFKWKIVMTIRLTLLYFSAYDLSFLLPLFFVCRSFQDVSSAHEEAPGLPLELLLRSRDSALVRLRLRPG